MIGAQKQRFEKNNTAAYFFQHYVNWSPAGNLTQGNQVVLYAMYPGWDDKMPKNASNIWAGSALFLVTNVAGNIVTLNYTSSTGVDLSTLKNVTATNVRGFVSSNWTAPLLMQGSFTPANSTDWPSFQLALSENTTIGAKSRVKLGDKVNYRVGWRLFNSTSNPTDYSSVDSDL
jgi:hypothetical protein